MATAVLENEDLRDQIISLQEEKKTAVIELENLKSTFVEGIAEVSILARGLRNTVQASLRLMTTSTVFPL